MLSAKVVPITVAWTEPINHFRLSIRTQLFTPGSSTWTLAPLPHHHIHTPKAQNNRWLPRRSLPSCRTCRWAFIIGQRQRVPLQFVQPPKLLELFHTFNQHMEMGSYDRLRSIFHAGAAFRHPPIHSTSRVGGKGINHLMRITFQLLIFEISWSLHFYLFSRWALF